ncbi:MAG: hypothetical protein VX815_08315 [Gemmatimonadota bacterium]|nr:hypothetical protein [Gemmatimonadota bacterium]
MCRANHLRVAVVAALLVAFAGCEDPAPEAPGRMLVDDVAMADETNGENWLAFGTSSRYRQRLRSRPADLSPDRRGWPTSRDRAEVALASGGGSGN